MTYIDAIQAIEEHIKLHPDLHHSYIEAFQTAVAVLREKVNMIEKYKNIQSGTTLYFVNEIREMVEVCNVVKVEYGLRGLRRFTVKFSTHKEIGEYMPSFLGYLFFLDETTALEELRKHLGGEATDPKDPEEDPGDNVAVVNGQMYESFADCIANVDENSEIKILQDIELSSKLTISKSLTIDLNGNHLINSGSSNYIGINNSANVKFTSSKESSEISHEGTKWAVQVSGGATLTLGKDVKVTSPNSSAAILLSSGNLILDGGSVENNVSQAIHGQTNSNVHVISGNISSAGYAIKLLSGSSAEIESGVLVGTKGVIDAYGTGTVKISGGTLTTPEYSIAVWDTVNLEIEGDPYITGQCAILTNGSANPSNQGVNIIIRGGVLQGDYTGVYLPAGTMKVEESCQIQGKAGIVVRGGRLNVSGGTIRAFGNGTVQVGDAGYTIPAAGIAVDKNIKYNNGNVDVTISGGSISSPQDIPAFNYTENGLPSDNAEGIVITSGTFSDDSASKYTQKLSIQSNRVVSANDPILLES